MNVELCGDSKELCPIVGGCLYWYHVNHMELFLPSFEAELLSNQRVSSGQETSRNSGSYVTPTGAFFLCLFLLDLEKGKVFINISQTTHVLKCTVQTRMVLFK